MDRKETGFTPDGAKMLLRKLEESGEISVNSARSFKNDVGAFYDRCLAQISLWEKGFEDIESHKWVTTEVTWSELETTTECINNIHGKTVIDVDSLFDKVIIAKYYMSDSVRMENCEEARSTSEVKWVEMSDYFNGKIRLFPISSMLLNLYFLYPAPQQLWRECCLSWTIFRLKTKGTCQKALSRP